MSMVGLRKALYNLGISVSGLQKLVPEPGVTPPRWTPANMAAPPDMFFDMDDVEGSPLTLLSPNSHFPNVVTSKFDPTISAAFGTASHLLPDNPYFGGRRAVALRGSANSGAMVTGANAKFKNIAACTLFWLGRHPTLVTDATAPGEGAVYVFISTGLANNSVRYQIGGSATIKSSYRVSGRRTDAVASAGSDLTGNVGTGVDLIWAEFDHVNARLKAYRNDVEVYNQPWLTTGVSDNTDPVTIGIGSYSAALSSMPASEWQVAGGMPRIVSQAERQKFAGWALHRVGLQHQLAANHPYRYTPP